MARRYRTEQIERCEICGKDETIHKVIGVGDGVGRCCDCHNAAVEASRAARAAELAARPKCRACGERPCTWVVAGVDLCGWCKRKVERRANSRHRAPRSAGLAGLAMFAPSAQPSAAEVLEMAR